MKGVYWCTYSEKWVSQIMCNGKRYHVKSCDDPIDCARAYDRKAIELFGEDFALTNENMGLL